MKLRTLTALLSGALLASLVAAPAVADAAPVAGTAPLAYPPSICSTVSVSTTRPALGESLVVTGLNFEPNASVTLRLSPLRSSGNPGDVTKTYPAVRSDARGSFTTRITMPDSVANRGAYILRAISGFTSSGSCPADPSVELQLGAAAASTGGGGSTGNGGTAFTGLDIAALLGIAALLLAGGGVLVHRGRRSRSI